MKNGESITQTGEKMGVLVKLKLLEKIRNSNNIRTIKNRIIDNKEIYMEEKKQKKTQKQPETVPSDDQKTTLENRINNLNKQDITPTDFTVSVILVLDNEELLGTLTHALTASRTDFIQYIIINNTGTRISGDEYEIPVEVYDNTTFTGIYDLIDIRGEYVLFINSSVEITPDSVDKLACHIPRDDKTGMVGVCLVDKKNCNTLNCGITFRRLNNKILPVYKNYRKQVDFKKKGLTENIMVDENIFIIKSEVLRKHITPDRNYSMTDMCMDLSFNLHDNNYKNYIMEDVKICSDNNQIKKYRKSRVLDDNTRWLYYNFYDDKINSRRVFTTPLSVAFVVTQCDDNTKAGDFFTALSLTNYLKKFGWNITYLPQIHNRDRKNWYFIDDDIDIVISMLDRYNVDRIHCANKPLKIAWLRNWFERWTVQSYFDEYDIILASSTKACDYITEKTSKKAHLYPLATDISMFNRKTQPDEKYNCDYCFTGSFWKNSRDIIKCINTGNEKYTFNIYGANWDEIKQLRKYNKGFLPYDEIPKVYASAKIILDDANHVTKKYGSVNSRVFDALASNRLVLTNGSVGNNELFNGEIPEYHTKEDLDELLDKYLNNDELRKKKTEKLRSTVLKKHTYKNRALKLKQIIEQYYIN